ncbi:MAG: hypothetical protein GTO45_28195 [Candidatus Aminicenantes bacterium]|nr:hypothetical protein [Candidatus Aminicenantes bacterium]NIM82682.1 hypothetical protein [Candidatus Aminicenantes bacterium]NIN22055.1 hypothetical protein [Candidatus Aminicenantes bacterium]NIN45812.1 hypothetical protein [Candidatus Aminicenantes bacterium]NIN88650.1 hypothetical protein [Candidatus Aminicenantes bacterium]
MRAFTIITTAVLILLFKPLFPEELGTEARIEKQGDIWRLEIGASSGVTLGVEGYLMKKTYSAKDKTWTHEKIARFKVSKVFHRFCFARVVQWMEGFSDKDASWAQFIKHLASPEESKKKTGEGPELVIEVGKTSRWYLEKGEEAENRLRYDLAIEYYEKVLEKDPDDPGARLRMPRARGKYYIQQGDLDYKNQEDLSAYEYYIHAFLILKEDDYIAAEKILDVWENNENLYKKTREYEVSPTQIMGSLTNYCNKLLEENHLEKLSILAQKMKRFAENQEMKNKLDTWIIVKDIQNDLDNSNFEKLLTSIQQSLDENNLYKASYIIEKMERLDMDDETRKQLTDLKEKLGSKKAQIKVQREVKLRKERIRELKKEAEDFAALGKYDEAINRYIEISKLAPDNSEYIDKRRELLSKKFESEKKQKEIEAQVKRDELIFHAEDYYKKDLFQDALDKYVEAYKILPEEGKALAGIVKVLETCSPGEAKFITADLLERKLNRFIKDFLNYISREYLQSNDEKGWEILSKITFITNNNQYNELMRQMQSNLYTKYLKSGDDQFKIADFDNAEALYKKAQSFGDTAEISTHLKVCSKLKHIKELMGRKDTQKLNMAINSISVLQEKREILVGLLNLSERYMENFDFKKAKFLYKRAAQFKISDIKERIKTLKEKEKELKKKAKEMKKKKS